MSDFQVKTTIPILEKNRSNLSVWFMSEFRNFHFPRFSNIWSKDFASVESRILNKIGEVIEEQIYTLIVKGDLVSSIKYKR